MSTIIFGDIHGSTFWKTAVKENPDCRYVFLGDYLDPYEPVSRQNLLENLRQIIDFKRNNCKNVVLLIGNHDLHYITPLFERGNRYDSKIADSAKRLFASNADLFQNAYQHEKTIITHAGISRKWFFEDFRGVENKDIAEQLNHPRTEQIAALYHCGEARGGDRGSNGGIFWADYTELEDNLADYQQIVGHTRVEEIQEIQLTNGSVVFCDCLWNEQYLKIDL